MSLTGSLVQWGSAALAVLASAAVVVLWRRLAGGGPAAVLARSAALLAVNLLVVLALLVWANDRFSFYSGWADLAGGSAGAGVLTPGTAPVALTAAQSAALAAGTTRPTAPEGEPVPGYGGRVQQLTVTGASGVNSTALVVLPRGYDDPSQAGTTYPVLVALHGFPGDPRQWLTALDVRPAVAQAVGAHQLDDPIVVIPDLGVPAGRDTECVDGPPGQPQLETWLSTDLPQAVEASYRARTSPQAWAAMGFSMGGWCAAELAVLHPQQYGAGIVMGGYFRYDPGSGYEAFGPGSPQAQAHDLVAVAAGDPPATSLFVASSRDDPESWPTTQAFLAAAKAPMSVTSLVARTGGHRSGVWAAQMPQALAWLGSTAPGFAPPA
ncbi:alpha/beta hydrolase [Quadrisphaera sp. KR29]|uniref:alpha/beta hydrolase n=1 Tax=Quadrisphaera sp. KR29 TaxID=3461391 RepID=UPI004043A286